MRVARVEAAVPRGWSAMVAVLLVGCGAAGESALPQAGSAAVDAGAPGASTIGAAGAAAPEAMEEPVVEGGEVEPAPAADALALDAGLVPPLRQVVDVGGRLRLTFEVPISGVDATPEDFVLRDPDAGSIPLSAVAVKGDDPFVLEIELADAAAQASLAGARLSFGGEGIEVDGQALAAFEGLPVAPGKDLFLLLGQSNMAGRGALDEAPMAALAHVDLLAVDDAWEPARHPLNRYSTVAKDPAIQQVGPGYAFGEAVQAALGKDVGLVVNAQGGPGIGAWQPGAPEGLLEAAVERAVLAERSGVVRAVLWHHGEANRESTDTYGDKVGVMLDALRAALGAPSLHLVAGELARWREDNAAINQVIAGLPDRFEGVSHVSAEGLEADAEAVSHFSAASQEVLGQRYAERVLAQVYGLDVAGGS